MCLIRKNWKILATVPLGKMDLCESGWSRINLTAFLMLEQKCLGSTFGEVDIFSRMNLSGALAMKFKSGLCENSKGLIINSPVSSLKSWYK